MKTVGELKKFIKDLPDDMLLLDYHNGMEQSGYMNNVFCAVSNMRKETRHTYDRFDYTEYDYEVYVPAENGQLCLIFD